MTDTVQLLLKCIKHLIHF